MTQEHTTTFLKSATGQGDDNTNGCLLDYSSFKEKYKPIVIDITKQQVFNADTKAIQQINFTGNLEPTESTAMFLLLKKSKKLR